MTRLSSALASMISSDAPSGSSPLAGCADEQGTVVIAKNGQGFSFKSARLDVRAKGGMATVVLEQTFANPHEQTLDVTYRMPLPEDGAVVGYTFEIDGRTIVGEIDTKKKARDRFQEAVSQGRTAGLLESQRANIFTQEIGNIPSQATLVARITIEQKLSFLPEGAWEFRFPTVIGPRYVPKSQSEEVSELRVHVAPNVSDLPTMLLKLGVFDTLSDRASLESPSHGLIVQANSGVTEASFVAEAGARLDRDIIVRWRVARPQVGLCLTTGRPQADAVHASSAYGLLTVTPPEPNAQAVMARDLIVLIDTSGSMSGLPLAKAKQAVLCMLDGLTEKDTFQLSEFSDAPRWFTKETCRASRDRVEMAKRWVQDLQAGGATEMYTAIKETLQEMLPGSQRQVLIVTDGYFGGEATLVEYMLTQLPRSCRLHTVGVGGASNGALLGPLARAGRGVDARIDADGDVERQVAPLMKRLVAPVLTNVTLSGDVLLSHTRLADVFGGAPLLAGVKIRPEGGTLTVEGDTQDGPWKSSLAVEAVPAGKGDQTAVHLYARECVADLETRWVIAAERESCDKEIESLGLVFGIVTRFTSFVAIDSETTPVRRNVVYDDVPQEVPYGALLAGYTSSALASSGGAPPARRMSAPAPAAGMPSFSRVAPAMSLPSRPMPLPSASRRSPPPTENDENQRFTPALRESVLRESVQGVPKREQELDWSLDGDGEERGPDTARASDLRYADPTTLGAAKADTERAPARHEPRVMHSALPSSLEVAAALRSEREKETAVAQDVSSIAPVWVKRSKRWLGLLLGLVIAICIYLILRRIFG
jgi:Ca-activated chloride channel homolog